MKVDEAPDGFLARWARRKEQVRSGVAVAPQPAALPVEAPVAKPPEAALVQEIPAAEPLPTLADVALLTRESDYSRFVATGVDDGVKQAAMKKLFADPHFNVMDGLDTYIDDYGKPDPIPLAMLRQMNQSKMLRLFDDDEEDDETKKQQIAPTPAHIAPDATPDHLTAPDDHADLRLQQDDAAGQPGPDQGAGA
ncbi:MAG: DUF3306 domain-containing protein [Pseudomonadota bacterium]